MPWCDSCDVYLAPNAVKVGGTCPTCDELADAADLTIEESTRPAWHFWLMVVALVAYLGWRLVEGVVWAAQQI